MNITDIDISDLNAIVGHVWEHSPANADREYYQEVTNTCAAVTVGALEFAVGYDPNEEGILWAINHLDSDGSRDGLYYGGWAPEDTQTAQEELAGVITILNGGTVKAWEN